MELHFVTLSIHQLRSWYKLNTKDMFLHEVKTNEDDSQFCCTNLKRTDSPSSDIKAHVCTSVEWIDNE